MITSIETRKINTDILVQSIKNAFGNEQGEGRTGLHTLNLDTKNSCFFP